MYNFKNSVLADGDIIEILSYTFDSWGEEQMREYESQLEHGRITIRQDPYLMGSKSRDDLISGCRSFRVNHHYFFYRVNEKENIIEIARILHEQMDFKLQVREEYFPT